MVYIAHLYVFWEALKTVTPESLCPKLPISVNDANVISIQQNEIDYTDQRMFLCLGKYPCKCKQIK